MGGLAMTEKDILLARLTIFLKEYDAYDKFVHNLDLYGSQKTIDEFASYCIEMNIRREVIARAFAWVSSNEGNDFWFFLHEKFEEDYYNLPTEVEQNNQWANMWEE